MSARHIQTVGVAVMPRYCTQLKKNFPSTSMRACSSARPRDHTPAERVRATKSQAPGT
jgi:hypothetical protein